MTAALIFKMEFYKFLNDKKYLIIAGVLALINIVMTISALDSISTSYAYYGYGYEAASAIGTLFLGFLLSVIFLIIYPFHALSIDYKNNVMALMMASGVNRTKLYFAKILGAVVTSLLLMLIVIIIPFILVSLKYGTDIIDAIIQSITFFSQYYDVPLIVLLFAQLVSYVFSIVLINAAVIFSKGSSKTVLIYFGLLFGFMLIQSMIIDPLVGAFEMEGFGLIAYNLIVDIIKIVVVGYISLRQMQNQNL